MKFLVFLFSIMMSTVICAHESFKINNSTIHKNLIEQDNSRKKNSAFFKTIFFGGLGLALSIGSYLLWNYYCYIKLQSEKKSIEEANIALFDIISRNPSLFIGIYQSRANNL